MEPPTGRWLNGWFVSAALVAAVTGVLLALEGHVDLRGLVVLYLLAVIPVAVLWGRAHAVVVSVASVAVFDFLFVRPRYSLVLSNSDDWVRFAAFVVTAVVISHLAVSSRERARDVERIFDLSLDLLCILGEDGYFKRVNPAFDRALGYSSRELRSRPFLDFVHPQDRERTREALTGALARGEEVVRFENRYVSINGSVRWLEWNARPAPAQRVVYCAARDVTERRRGEERLREAQRMVEASRDELRVLADEQAALRRVATLVARALPPDEIFSAVADEVRRLLGAEDAAVARFEPSGAATVVAVVVGSGPPHAPIGSRLETDDLMIATPVFRTGRPARLDEEDWSTASGPLAERLRRQGVRSAVASPIVVEDRLWGAILASTGRERLPPDTEERMANFTELVATAIANAESSTELAASRARVVAAADETRHRFVRDLHDGAQQRLVHTVITLQLARGELGEARGPGVQLMQEALDHAEHAMAELRDLAHGILPAALRQGGLRAGIEDLIAGVRLPVSAEITAERLTPALEATAYFIVAEALTNTVKHAHAHSAQISAVVERGVLRLRVCDDGVGGAQTDGGSGLLGLRDRAGAVNGRLDVESRPGAGTVITATLPIPGSRPA